MYNLYIYILNMYIYIYICIHLSIYMFIYVYIYMFTCMHACVFFPLQTPGRTQDGFRDQNASPRVRKSSRKNSHIPCYRYTLVHVPSSRKHSTRVSTSFTWPSTQGTKTCCKLLSLTFWLLVLWRNAAQRRKVEWREGFKDWWTTWLKWVVNLFFFHFLVFCSGTSFGWVV